MEEWVANCLDAIAVNAREHPFLIGALLFVIVLSTAVHVIVFTGHLFLGLSKYFRRQTADLKNLTSEYRDEWNDWRHLFEIAQISSKPSEEVSAELAKKDISAAQTIDIVAEIVDLVVLRLRDETNQPTNLRPGPPHSNIENGSE
jgi:ABC-type uncharacterized transport system fused permease/ATPase subunit